jgi:heat shock protein HslJ
MRIERSFLGICLIGLSACAAAPAGSAPAAAAGPPTLSGTRWVGVVDASTDRRAIPRLEFVREGRVTGFTGCNLLSGTWTVEGNEARMGPTATTKRMCLGPEGELEKRVLAAIADRSRITREGGKLVLVSPAGERFEFAEAAAGGY